MGDLTLLAIVFLAAFLVVAVALRRVWRRMDAGLVGRAAVAGGDPIGRFIGPEELARLRMGFAGAGAVGALLLGLGVGAPPFVAVALAAVAAFAGWRFPVWLYRRKAEARRADFERQMLNVVLGLAGNVKAGMGIAQALRTLAEHTPGVVREELSLTVEELPLCKDVNETLDRLYARVPCEDLLLMKSAIRLSTKSGGRLTEIMAQLAETIRQRADFRERLKNRVAQGKFEAILMACAPVGIFLILLLIDTQLMLPLVTRPVGWCAVGAVAVLETLGFLWIRKIVTIEV